MKIKEVKLNRRPKLQKLGLGLSMGFKFPSKFSMLCQVLI